MVIKTRPGIEQRSAKQIAVDIKHNEKEVVMLAENVYIDTLLYRIQSVKEKMENARNLSLDKMKSNNSKEVRELAGEMDNLIVFCSNKLNGNTDCLEVLLNGSKD